MLSNSKVQVINYCNIQGTYLFKPAEMIGYRNNEESPMVFIAYIFTKSSFSFELL